jgi:hypothetical protein
MTVAPTQSTIRTKNSIHGAIAMRRHDIRIVALAALIAGCGTAAAQQAVPRPCAALRAVCMQAGFVPQGARAGEGLVVDCIRPIMQGIPQPPRAAKPLPAVDPQLVEACRAQNPNFGMVNAAQPRMQQQPQMAQPPQSAPAEPPQTPPSPR